MLPPAPGSQPPREQAGGGKRRQAGPPAEAAQRRQRPRQQPPAPAQPAAAAAGGGPAGGAAPAAAVELSAAARADLAALAAAGEARAATIAVQKMLEADRSDAASMLRSLRYLRLAEKGGAPLQVSQGCCLLCRLIGAARCPAQPLPHQTLACVPDHPPPLSLPRTAQEIVGRWGALSLDQQRLILDVALSAANKVARGASWRELEDKLQEALDLLE